MTMSKHTPGPWKVTHDTPTACAVIQSLDSEAGFPMIAVMMRGLAESEADARLIAAAPLLMGLYEELRGCRWIREDGGENKLAVTMANLEQFFDEEDDD